MDHLDITLLALKIGGTIIFILFVLFTAAIFLL